MHLIINIRGRGERPVIKRLEVVEKIQSFFAGRLSSEELGWWAFDLLIISDLEFEPGYERLIKDVLHALQYFHDTEPLMQQFYPDKEDLIYYLKCLQGEELYNPKRVIRWKV